MSTWAASSRTASRRCLPRALPSMASGTRRPATGGHREARRHGARVHACRDRADRHCSAARMVRRPGQAGRGRVVQALWRGHATGRVLVGRLVCLSRSLWRCPASRTRPRRERPSTATSRRARSPTTFRGTRSGRPWRRTASSSARAGCPRRTHTSGPRSPSAGGIRRDRVGDAYRHCEHDAALRRASRLRGFLGHAVPHGQRVRRDARV